MVTPWNLTFCKVNYKNNLKIHFFLQIQLDGVDIWCYGRNPYNIIIKYFAHINLCGHVCVLDKIINHVFTSMANHSTNMH